MEIRKAEEGDLDNCLHIDASYVTDQVWQLVEQPRGRERSLTFRPAVLPRPLRVQYPFDLQDLRADWERGECFLVAEQDGEFRGFADLVVAERGHLGWLKHLVVLEPYRRRRVGTYLLQAALAWSDLRGLHTVMADCQTKNYAAISLYQKNGLVFCGYNDMYYPNRDIALFFAHSLGK